MSGKCFYFIVSHLFIFLTIMCKKFTNNINVTLDDKHWCLIILCIPFMHHRCTIYRLCRCPELWSAGYSKRRPHKYILLYGICFVRSASNWCSASVSIVLRQHYIILDCFIMILALCEGKSIGHLWFSSYWPITRCFDVCLKKRLNKQPIYWWCETPCTQCEVTLMITAHDY